MTYVTYSTDSRQIEPGQIFVALKGERFDGHAYLPMVSDRGARAAVVEKETPDVAGLDLIRVDSPLAYWSEKARDYYQASLQGKTVALTGSNGKTTVKEMIKHILSQFGKVHATQGNLNNEIGVPKTLFQLQGDEAYSVIEMGAGQPKDIAYLRQWVSPDVALINNASAAHIGRYPNEETLARTKGEMIERLKPDAVVVLNADSPWFDLWQGMHANPLISFGENQTADVRCIARRQMEEGQHVTLDIKGMVLQGMLPVKGAHNALNACAAIAVAMALKIPPAQALLRLASFQPVGGRLATQFLLKGRLQLIDDSYNANPASVKAGIDVLAESAGTHWLVLGDMAELGDLAEAYHFEVGRYAAEQGIHKFFACGQWIAKGAEGFLKTRQVGEDLVCCADNACCGQKLLSAIHDFFATHETPENKVYLTLLIKGSRSSAMDEVVNYLREREAQL